MGLRELAIEMGNSLSSTLLLIMTANTLSFICCCYVILSSLVKGRFDFIPFLMIFLIVFVYLSIFVEAAHRVTDKVISL
jgi:hypothetical protein